MLSPVALENFSENGFLGLSDSQISLDDLGSLEKRFQTLRKDNSELSDYRINLSNIAVILNVPQQVITGRITEYPCRTWKENYTDFTLVQMANIHGFNASLNLSDPKEEHVNKLSRGLVSLLVQPWSSIRLENVVFHEYNQIDSSASMGFYDYSLYSLARNKVLKVLTIKPLSLISHGRSIVNFLTEHTELQRLRLQITESNRENWQELCQTVSRHPNLEYFHLDTSVLDANAYIALNKLLDENYRIKISVPEPTNRNVLKAYEHLKQRLSTPGLERFKADYLTQDTLLQVAVNSLEFLQKLKSPEQINDQVRFEKLFNFLVDNKSHLAITDDQKEDWIENAKVLPIIYQNHPEYLKNEASLVQLRMDALVADGNKTIGYVLLEKALETQNQSALETLLYANANLFEFPDNNEEAVLVNALQSKGDLKRIVVEYIQQDQRLVALAEEYLVAYPELKNLFKDFKNHLDKYGAHLVKKDNPSVLFSLSKNILYAWRKILDFENPSGTRGKECAELYLNLDKSLKIIAHNPEGATYDSFDEVHKIIIKMKEDSMKAVRGAFNSSFLHEEALALVSNFERQLMNVKKKVVNETFKNKDNEIKQLKEGRKQERSVFNGKSTQLEAENAEVRAENAEVRAENAEIKAENAEIKAENSAIRSENAEMKKKQVRMEKQLNALTRQIGADTHSEARSNPSSSQDQARGQTHRFYRP
jgi:hypothetical protein